jgi:hypothetical protein
MFGRARILLTIMASALVMPAVAQTPAPTTTVFDGTYLGVSRKFEEEALNGGQTWTRYCFEYGPNTLRIANGIARAGKLEGSVDPQGILVMRSFWDHFDGRVDSRGIVTGRSTGGCSYQWAWQKVPAPTMPFDGDYIGVSRELTNGGIGCRPSGVPGFNLIIRNSVSLWQWQGTVSPQGIVSLRMPNGTPVDGQVDRQGMIRVQGTSAAGCTNIWVWRKQAG